MNPQGLLGIVVITAAGYLLSERRQEIPWKRVGLALLFSLALALLFTVLPADSLLVLNTLVATLEASANHGASFIFGYLAGGAAPFEVTRPEHSFIIAFRVFPLILVVGVLSNIAFHLGILGKIIQWLSVPVRKILKLSPELALGSAASIFFGTIEAPLVIKGWLKNLNRGELLALMTCTMSTIAGTVMVLYSSVLSTKLPGAAGHMMVASLMSVPCALAISLLLSPFAAEISERDAEIKSPYSSLGDAITCGISEGLQMILSITATLIVCFALIHLTNTILPQSYPLETLLSYPLRPVMWLVGISWEESGVAASLMAQKIILNEFVAYLQLAQTQLSERGVLICLYSFCGFANLGSLAIVSGGLGQLIPERRVEIMSLALKSVLAGNLATLLTGAIISFFV